MENRDYEKQYLIQLWKQNKFDNRQIAKMVNDRYNTDYWDNDRVRDRIRKQRKKEDRMKIDNIVVPETKNYIKTTKNKKGLIICDLHFPHYREDFFDILEKHKHEIDFIVMGGDTFNNDSLSKFPEINKVSFEEEIINFHKFMTDVRNSLPQHIKIYIIRGNHEHRLYKYIAELQQKQLAQFVNPEVIQMLVDGFTVYKNSKQVKYAPIENLQYIPHWFMNINDELIICHPKDFSKVETKVAMNAIDYFLKRGEKFKMIIVAHTHKYGESKRYGKFSMQAGCMCKPQKYSDVGSLGYTPQDYTYNIVEFDSNGNLDINKSKIYHLNELYTQTEDVDYKVII